MLYCTVLIHYNSLIYNLLQLHFTTATSRYSYNSLHLQFAKTTFRHSYNLPTLLGVNLICGFLNISIYRESGFHMLIFRNHFEVAKTARSFAGIFNVVFAGLSLPFQGNVKQKQIHRRAIQYNTIYNIQYTI